MAEANMAGGAAAGRKSELRSSTRFHIEDAVPLVYKKGLLASLGINRTNQAQAAVNLSEGGILVRTTDRMKAGTKVKVRLEIEKFKDILEAEGVVRWCFQSAKPGSNFYAGIRFTRVPSAVTLKISKLRGYFTSPEYRSRNVTRKRRDPLGVDFSG
jgi:Tfp pilus assembly protein PilZ